VESDPGLPGSQQPRQEEDDVGGQEGGGVQEPSHKTLLYFRTYLGPSVADPDPFDTDPGPAFHFDPDPAFQFDTDPDV
jgi:hypothetical protein